MKEKPFGPWPSLPSAVLLGQKLGAHGAPAGANGPAEAARS